MIAARAPNHSATPDIGGQKARDTAAVAGAAVENDKHPVLRELPPPSGESISEDENDQGVLTKPREIAGTEDADEGCCTG
ncbi:unnamed protein product, partial [Amoebophrya sp. A25]